jgi:hypothetical protein
MSTTYYCQQLISNEIAAMPYLSKATNDVFTLENILVNSDKIWSANGAGLGYTAVSKTGNVFQLNQGGYIYSDYSNTKWSLNGYNPQTLNTFFSELCTYFNTWKSTYGFGADNGEINLYLFTLGASGAYNQFPVFYHGNNANYSYQVAI